MIRSLMVCMAVGLGACSTSSAQSSATANSPATSANATAGASTDAPAQTATTARTTETETAPQEAAAASEQVLSIRVRDLHVNSANRTVRYEPDSSVQRASYVQWTFDYDEFVRVAGANPTADFRARVVLTNSRERTAGTTPNSPSPMGGIRITENTAKILGIAP
jgi:hypothetical protein